MLLPELGLERRRPGEPTVFAVQSCAKYGKRREIYVPAGALDAVETFVLLERPQIVEASVKALARKRQDLFVVDHIDHEAGTLRGVLDGQRRTFTMSAMTPQLRRTTVREAEGGLESLAVFVGHGGWMLGPRHGSGSGAQPGTGCVFMPACPVPRSCRDGGGAGTTLDTPSPCNYWLIWNSRWTATNRTR